MQYLIGLGILVAMIVYPILFCWCSYKLTGDHLCDGEYGFLGGFMFAYIFPLAIAMILALPLVIYQSIFGG